MSARSPDPIALSAELVAFFASGVDHYVATRSRELLPESVLGVGILAAPGATTLTVFVHTEGAARTLANLADNGQVATTMSLPVDHRTVQLKGTVVAVRAGGEADRIALQGFREVFAETLALIGIPRALTRAIPWWPSTAITFTVSAIYTQTPGPSAGQPLAP